MVTYKLKLEIFDTARDDGESRYSPVLVEEAGLDVTSLRSIDDREAMVTLTHIIKQQLAPKGSTVLERRAIAERERPIGPGEPTFVDAPMSAAEHESAMAADRHLNDDD